MATIAEVASHSHRIQTAAAEMESAFAKGEETLPTLLLLLCLEENEGATMLCPCGAADATSVSSAKVRTTLAASGRHRRIWRIHVSIIHHTRGRVSPTTWQAYL